MTAYRDTVEALRTQVAQLERELDGQLRRVDETLLPLRRVHDAKIRADAIPADDDDTREIHRRLAEYAEALRAALVCAGTHADPRPPPGLTPSRRWTSGLARLIAGPPVAHDEAVSVIRGLDPATVVTTSDNHGVAGQFHAEGVPTSFCFCYRYRLTRGSLDPYSQVGSITMAIGVPLKTPALRVRPTSWRDILFLRPLGVVPRGPVGDPDLDQLFIVQLGAADAGQLLTTDVRGALLELARHDPPTLTVGEGAATLHWYSTPTPAPIGAAARLLAGLHVAVSSS